jgi:hypothetical protein
MAKIAQLALILALAACTTPRGSFCEIADPIRLSSAAVDAMSDAEVSAALAHNRKGERLCGWHP